MLLDALLFTVPRDFVLINRKLIPLGNNLPCGLLFVSHLPYMDYTQVTSLGFALRYFSWRFPDQFTLVFVVHLYHLS